MTKVHILTEGFVTPNGQAFLFPLMIHRKVLRDHGIEWREYHGLEDSLYECDVLIIDSKYYRDRWITNTEGIIQEVGSFRRKVSKILYFDTTDSSGWIQVELLPLVDGYLKSQILKNRSRYLRPMYGHRAYTDYYHQKYGVTDSQPEFSIPVSDPGQLDKIRVSWNSGLANYSLYGPYFAEIYRYIPTSWLLYYPQKFVNPLKDRPYDISCRMGLSYSRQSVAWQRRAIRERLGSRIPTTKLSRRQYFRELEQSKIVLSPFGFGEITLKDFETFLAGALLLKPDGSHMLTWPDFFVSDKTVVCHDWDLLNLESKIEEILSNRQRYVAIAKEGQQNYLRYTSQSTSPELFCQHFRDILAA
ncbi:MAG: hypothetical protein NPIRA02_16200 [Nitrospirales bacterium]|nr:MAG: hypothetical protein NPIRA02_16200 [Nitrospirales bacterium]